MTQLEILPLGTRQIFQKGSPTSKEAAETHSRAKAERDRSLILAWLTKEGPTGATHAELSAALGIPRHVLCFRCAELSGRYEGWEKKIRQTTERRGRGFIWKVAA